ncbi:hypothetical protein PGT21_018482 [Puccinia graminis f. sp. tritici]|uniref:Uncharacterized protein n=1 Tax=Puccinia graminis f. sp. tritici TaxID=56615 RepID=A0A5B0NSW6_PUCGR|nr:hypothetical protein PGT21_018482 [Puccinia graminis f. sp. tritici]KAA1125510.1 hypothetical protein PGTUg99_011433 [Puccinia graminis f. sp. tritici]
MVRDNPLRIFAIRWRDIRYPLADTRQCQRIPASASGYPPAGADSGADVLFPPKSWRISGYPKGYPVTRRGHAAGRNPSRRGGTQTSSSEGIPSDELVLSSGGIPPNELVYIPACREALLPASRISNQLVRRSPSRRGGTQTSSLEGIPSDELVLSSGGIPPDELVYIPARREALLPASRILNQLVRRSPSRRAGSQTSSSEGIPSDELVLSSGGIPPEELVYIPARREGVGLLLTTSSCRFPIPIVDLLLVPVSNSNRRSLLIPPAAPDPSPVSPAAGPSELDLPPPPPPREPELDPLPPADTVSPSTHYTSSPGGIPPGGVASPL